MKYSTQALFISMIDINLMLESRFRDIVPIYDDTLFLFDIDDTLYKISTDMKNDEENRLRAIFDKLHDDKQYFDKQERLSFEEVYKSKSIFSESFVNYFTDLTPYTLEVKKEPVNYKKYINRNDALIETIRRLPYRKWCFTNGLKCRAEVVLNILGLLNSFEGVLCMDNDNCTDIVAKPRDSAYNFVERFLKINDKRKIYFFDDLVENIEAGKLRKWNCIHVKRDDDIVVLIEQTCRMIEDIER